MCPGLPGFGKKFWKYFYQQNQAGIKRVKLTLKSKSSLKKWNADLLEKHILLSESKLRLDYELSRETIIAETNHSYHRSSGQK